MKDSKTIATIQELLQGRNLTEEKLKACNGWAQVADKLVGYDLYLEHENLIYPDEEEEQIVKEHNASRKDVAERYILQIPPEPWGGNILNPKVVILSLNPGYLEWLNKDLARMFRAQIAEEIMEDKRQMLRLEQTSLMGLGLHNSTSILGNCYWEETLKPLGIAAYGEKDYTQVYKDVAILQYLAYSSTVKSLPKQILPSQQFTRLLIKYLAQEKKNVVFLLMRAKKEWKSLMGEDIWNSLSDANRIILSKNYRNQAITEKNVGDDNFAYLVKTLSKK